MLCEKGFIKLGMDVKVHLYRLIEEVSFDNVINSQDILNNFHFFDEFREKNRLREYYKDPPGNGRVEWLNWHSKEEKWI